MRSPTRRRRIGVLSVMALLAATVVVSLLPGGAASAAPVTGPMETVSTACNNTFQPTKFLLDYEITPTIDAPSPLYPGGSFTAQFEVNERLAASFLNGAYEALGSAVALPITAGNVTIGGLENADGSPLLLPIAPVTIPAQTPNGLPWDPVTNPVVDDVILPIGTTSVGTFTVPASPVLDGLGTPKPASFQILGNAYAPGDTLPAGVTETGWTGAGLSATLTTTGLQTYATALLGGALPASLVCMGGQWTVGPPIPPATTPGYYLPLIPPTGFSEVTVTPLPVPTVNISAITGQTTTSAARAGNEITFGGPNWAAGTVTAVELCDSGGANCDPGGLTGVTASITAGTLSGTATVDASATTGARTLKVTTDQAESDTTPITILGTPTLALSAGSGPANGFVNLTGTNWNPGPTTAALPLDAGNSPLAGPTPVVVNATGGMSGTIQTPAGTAAIIVADGNPALPTPPAPGSVFALAGFSINQNAQDCGNGSPLTGCALNQSVILNIEAGTFSWSQQTPFIVLNSTTTGGSCVEANKDTCFGLQLNGQNQVATGSLNEVTIIDARGQNAGWQVTAVMTDLVTGAGGANKVIPAGNMTLAPACAVVDGGPPVGTAAVITGAAAPLDPTTPIPVCSANPNEAGGTFTVNGGLSLQVPASQAAGNYQATITLTAV